jgi:C-terminal processing protease CtpA/Prc
VDANLKVVEIVPGEGADRAGVKPGDVLEALDGTPLTSTAQADQVVLKSIGAEEDTGQASTLTVRRAAQALTLRILATPPIDRGGTLDKPVPTFTAIPAGYDYY